MSKELILEKAYLKKQRNGGTAWEISEEDERSRADDYALKAKAYHATWEWEVFVYVVLGQVAHLLLLSCFSRNSTTVQNAHAPISSLPLLKGTWVVYWDYSLAA